MTKENIKNISSIISVLDSLNNLMEKVIADEEKNKKMEIDLENTQDINSLKNMSECIDYLISKCYNLIEIQK